MGVKGIGLDLVVEAVHRGIERLAQYNPTDPTNQEFQYRELPPRYHEWNVITVGATIFDVESEIADFDGYALVEGAASHDSARPGDEFRWLEGLADIVVRSVVQGVGDLIWIVPRRQDNCPRTRPKGPQFTEELDSVTIRQPAIKDD